jgi:type II secretory pathway pseudopilin PulG
MPTIAHVIYIPAMLMLGIVLGYVLGSRAARDAFAAEQARKEARAARRAARDANPSPTTEAKATDAESDSSTT